MVNTKFIRELKEGILRMIFLRNWGDFFYGWSKKYSISIADIFDKVSTGELIDR